MFWRSPNLLNWLGTVHVMMALRASQLLACESTRFRGSAVPAAQYSTPILDTQSGVVVTTFCPSHIRVQPRSTPSNEISACPFAPLPVFIAIATSTLRYLLLAPTLGCTYRALPVYFLGNPSLDRSWYHTGPSESQKSCKTLPTSYYPPSSR